jgi:hypothetical protein
LAGNRGWWDAELGGGWPGPVVELSSGASLLCSGEADFQSVDFAEPALPFGFADVGEQVGTDLDDAGPLVGVHAEQGTPQTCS